MKALRLLQSDKHKGKLVLSWTPDAQTPVLRSPAPPLRLEDGVILLAGGMGGLGRSLARILATHGAKMMDLSPSDLDTGRVLHSYGVDSLAAIDIVNWALRECQAGIAVFDVMAA